MLSALESAAIPIPSEIVVPFSGFLATTGRFTLPTVVAVATLGNFVGSVVLYWIGRSGGLWILERYGMYVFIRKRHLEAGHTWFEKYGNAAVFWSRMLPLVRTFVSLPAGIARMAFGRFSLYTIIGSLPWNVALAYGGYKAGEHWDVLHKYFQKADVAVIVFVAIGIILFAKRRIRRVHE